MLSDEEIQDVALKLDLANMELQTIDEVLARRPALGALKHRAEKIERLCTVASFADKTLCEIMQLARTECSHSEILAFAETALKLMRGEKESL